jgi:hypothetical protein
MIDILPLLEPELEKTIESLNRTQFAPDPIAGAHFSRMVSLLSSSYKRHGYILERSILEVIKAQDGVEAWREESFAVSNTADMLVASALPDPDSIANAHLAYAPGHRSIQVDVIMYRKADKSAAAYEVKRASGYHDAGKRRQMLRDALCVKVLLRDYLKQRGLDVQNTNSHIIFYYGKMSIAPPMGLRGNGLDDHFGFPVLEHVEKVNTRFRDRLFQILSA